MAVVISALAMVVAACGQSDGETATDGSDTTEAAATAESNATADSTAAPTSDATTADPPTEEVGPASPDNAALGDFPDVDVADVAAGTSINLRQELSGGDSPILLWFYAPH